MKWYTESGEERDPLPIEYWKYKAKTDYWRGWFTAWTIAALLWWCLK